MYSMCKWSGTLGFNFSWQLAQNASVGQDSIQSIWRPSCQNDPHCLSSVCSFAPQHGAGMSHATQPPPPNSLIVSTPLFSSLCSLQGQWMNMSYTTHLYQAQITLSASRTMSWEAWDHHISHDNIQVRNQTRPVLNIKALKVPDLGTCTQTAILFPSTQLTHIVMIIVLDVIHKMHNVTKQH